MKKLIIIFSFSLFLFLAFSPNVFGQTSHCLPLGNIDCSGSVSVIDLSYLISNFGTNNQSADLDDSSLVNTLDLSILLSNFGKTQPTPTPTVIPANCLSIIVPAYFNPEDSSLWNQTTTYAPTVSIVIVNLADGAGTTVNPDFVAVLSQLSYANVKAVGYVDSNYTNRNLSTIEEDIDNWDRLYGIKDIFIDQVTNDNNSNHISFYNSLASYIINRKADALIIWNPGITFVSSTTAASYLNIPGIWTIFESDYNSYLNFTFPSWVNSYPKERFYHLVYGVSNTTQMSNVLTKARQNNAYYVYATNDILPNPWDSLPSYFANQATEIRNYCEGIPTTTPTPVNHPTPTPVIQPTITPIHGSIIIDHTAIEQFDQIPDNYLTLAKNISSLYIHASVGGTISHGLDCLSGALDNSTFCRNISNTIYYRSQWIWQAHTRGGCVGKLQDLQDAVTNQPNFQVYHQKYCYFEGLDDIGCCGNPPNPTKTLESYNTYVNTMNNLESAHPGKIFVWWTIPYPTNIDVICGNDLNNRIRQYAREHQKTLFDIADIETYTPQNTKYTVNGLEAAYPHYCGEYKNNPNAVSCHPADSPFTPEGEPDGGQVRLAKAFWVLMARIAGWDGQ